MRNEFIYERNKLLSIHYNKKNYKKRVKENERQRRERKMKLKKPKENEIKGNLFMYARRKI